MTTAKRQDAVRDDDRESRSLTTIVGRLARFYGALPVPPCDAFGAYVWKVLSFQATPQRRDSAMAALQQIRALTPDAVARAPRGRLEEAVALAGPRRDERLRALTAGAAAFRRNPELGRALKRPLPEARTALAQLPHLTDADGEWLLLFAGDQPTLPADSRTLRVLTRVAYGAAAASPQVLCASAAAELQHDLRALRQAAVYLSHHGLVTCTDGDPHCSVCPLLNDCPEGRLRQG